MTDPIIPACLIVDDFPLNASSWRRVQVDPLELIEWMGVGAI